MVSPLCMPGSDERVVKIEEGRGDIVEAFMLMGKRVLTGFESRKSMKPFIPTIVKTASTSIITTTEEELNIPNFKLKALHALAMKLGLT